MRTLLATALISAALLAGGCASAPNEPTLSLETSKSPQAFSACVMPMLQQNALHPVLSQSQRHYRVVVSSAVAADNVIEAYKAANGGRVFVYERSLITSGISEAAKACV